MTVSLERVSNLAITVTCIVILSAVARNWYSGPDRASVTGYRVNDQVRGINPDVYRGSERTLLLFVRSTCHFCTASMDLYRRVVDAAGHSTRIVAVGPETQETLRKYFADNHVAISAAVNSSFTTALISATPTLLLVNGSGRILNIWVGQLPKPDEDRVMAAVR